MGTEGNSPQWHAVYVLARHEKRIGKYLAQKGIEHFVPVYRSQRTWANGTRPIVAFPLFPGYVFVRVSRDQRLVVLQTPGVLGFAGSSLSNPAVLHAGEIDKLRTGLQYCSVEPHPPVTEGQKVRIRTGSLAGMDGVLVSEGSVVGVVITFAAIALGFYVTMNREAVEDMLQDTPQ